jgi:hypothetical protein
MGINSFLIKEVENWKRMSFGFAIADIVASIELASRIYEAFRDQNSSSDNPFNSFSQDLSMFRDAVYGKIGDPGLKKIAPVIQRTDKLQIDGEFRRKRRRHFDNPYGGDGSWFFNRSRLMCPYCTICTEDFHVSGGLYRHIERVHAGERRAIACVDPSDHIFRLSRFKRKRDTVRHSTQLEITTQFHFRRRKVTRGTRGDYQKMTPLPERIAPRKVEAGLRSGPYFSSKHKQASYPKYRKRLRKYSHLIKPGVEVRLHPLLPTFLLAAVHLKVESRSYRENMWQS